MSAKDLVRRLVDEADMTPYGISEALENRVSGRTVYRWLSGDSVPKNGFDLEALENLVHEKLGRGDKWTTSNESGAV